MSHKKMNTYWPSILLALGLTSLTLGCAEISYGTPRTQDKLVRTHQAVVAGEAVDAAMEQVGTRLAVEATERCNLVEMNQYQRTAWSEKQNEDVAADLFLLGFGLVPATIGAVLVADSHAVYPDDRNGRLYNSTGPGSAVGVGVLLIVLGGLITTIPVIDFARSIGTKVEESNVTAQGTILKKDVPCNGGSTPAASRKVHGTIKSPRPYLIVLGYTNNNGQLNVDLPTVVPAAVFQDGPAPSDMDIWVGESRIGKVKLVPIHEHHAWMAVDIPGCQARQDKTACDSVRAFLQKFPNGDHAADAERVLAPQPLQVAGGDTPNVAVEPSQVSKEAAAAAEAARRACQDKCKSGCKKDAACTDTCVKEACR